MEIYINAILFTMAGFSIRYTCRFIETLALLKFLYTRIRIKTNPIRSIQYIYLQF